MREQAERGTGAFLMGAHLGSFEVIGSIGRRRPGLQVSMAMYEDNARKINSILAAINPALTPDVISLGHLDAMLKVAERSITAPLSASWATAPWVRSRCTRSPSWVSAPTCPPGRCALPPSCAARSSSWWVCIAAPITITWYSSRLRTSP